MSLKRGIPKNCSRCESDRLLDVTAKCSDCCALGFKGEFFSNGYVPPHLGIGDGDYIEFLMCLSCGQVQGHFPARDPINAMRVTPSSAAELQ